MKSSHMPSSKVRSAYRHAIACATLVLSTAVAPVHAESSTVLLEHQPWPGLTVKTEIASQLLETLGYHASSSSLSMPIILTSLAKGGAKVALGGWYPVEASIIDPAVRDGKVIKIAANISDALSGLAVPDYVHEAGVDSVNDLNRYAQRFDHKIYGIEAGSGTNINLSRAIQANRYQLGDWKLVSSSTGAMLAQVRRTIDQQGWIVFHAWKPHSMNVNYDIYYVKGPKDNKITDIKTTIYTLVPSEFPKNNPNLARFFRQYTLNSEIQSRWVHEKIDEQRPVDEIAQNWIPSHPEKVRKWLQGVRTVDGQPAFQAVQAAYNGNPQ